MISIVPAGPEVQATTKAAIRPGIETGEQGEARTSQYEIE
jgi:hypothetical protein